MPLTSSVKELGEILQKLINLDKIQYENETNNGSLAMRINFLTKSWARCNNENEKFVLSRTGNEKRKPFKLRPVNKKVTN